MNDRINGKTVMITGASGGLGENIARKCAANGANLILLARNIEKMKKIKEELESKYTVTIDVFQADVGRREDIALAFKQIRANKTAVDVLVNNAGFGVFDSFIEADLKDIENMFKVNVLGLMGCTKEILPSMIERNSGHIINIASQAGKLATPKSSGYAASKHAVLGFTNSLRMELAKTNIYVSAVNPGPIETNFFKVADKSGNYVKNVKKYMLTSDFVAEQVVQMMLRPKRELNLPKWMNMGSVLYSLFPGIADKLVGGLLNKK